MAEPGTDPDKAGFIGIPATTRFCSKVDDNRYAITCADTHNGNWNFNGESMQVGRWPCDKNGWVSEIGSGHKCCRGHSGIAACRSLERARPACRHAAAA